MPHHRPRCSIATREISVGEHVCRRRNCGTRGTRGKKLQSSGKVWEFSNLISEWKQTAELTSSIADHVFAQVKPPKVRPLRQAASNRHCERRRSELSTVRLAAKRVVRW